MIKYTELLIWVKDKILSYFETNNFPAAKELREYFEITIKHNAKEDSIKTGES